MATNPKVLLCDEATSSLDPHNTTAILKLLDDINQQYQLTIILITHEMDVIKQLCHRVAVLDQGQLLEINTVIDFLINPQTPVGKEFVRTCLKTDLPAPLVQRLEDPQHGHSHTLMSIEFAGEQTAEPVISQVIRKFQVDMNILQANVEFIRDEPIGIMLVEIRQPLR